MPLANATSDEVDRATGTSVRSMTGQGNASGASDIGTVSVELRTVNNRGFKCSVRSPDALSGHESRLESVVRRWVRRGSVNLSISLEREQGQTPVQINETILSSYIRQCRSAMELAGTVDQGSVTLNPGSLLSLPGVLSGEKLPEKQVEVFLSQVESVLITALEKLVQMRRREGEHMAVTLVQECEGIRAHVTTVAELVPQAAENYRERLEGKVKRVLAEYDAEVGAVDLLREVQIFADKADVSEEITRLDSHLSLFEAVVNGKQENADEPAGRKLDFIIQEMFRETNTIGSKSAHAQVSAEVVEIKCAIERMRELVQNLE